MFLDMLGNYLALAVFAIACGLSALFPIAYFVISNFDLKNSKIILLVFSLAVSAYVFFGLVNIQSTPIEATITSPSTTEEEHISYNPPPTYEPFIPPTIDLDSVQPIEIKKNSGSIAVVTSPTTVYPGTRPTVKIKGNPYTTYDITVRYSSGPSRAAGLEPKQSDSQGYVMWSWKVGTNTNPGRYPITVRGGGAEKIIYFEVLP